ncbi:MAG: hypothetical protein IAE83_10980 [Anaerolinea sp.]|nr:hypothetical protein [Anaerolinea sp.]MCC6973872.1 hypothetical protein [Anaerolineae bacterium]CAG0993824.1 hypothetical protein ANRL4_02636 [Anaerolineae bacterium]
MSTKPPPRFNAWHAGNLPDPIRLTRFRSQLEIRFALELEARHLRWFYEPQRLGESRYLLDFYLPDCKAWVEVKGRVSSRDHLALREVAHLLSVQRGHRLYMWTANKAYVVSQTDFKPLTHEVFWLALSPCPPEAASGEASPQEAPTESPDPAPPEWSTSHQVEED